MNPDYMNHLVKIIEQAINDLKLHIVSSAETDRPFDFTWTDWTRAQERLKEER